MSNKSRPFLYIKYTMKIGQDFLDLEVAMVDLHGLRERGGAGGQAGLGGG